MEVRTDGESGRGVLRKAAALQGAPRLLRGHEVQNLRPGLLYEGHHGLLQAPCPPQMAPSLPGACHLGRERVADRRGHGDRGTHM